MKILRGSWNDYATDTNTVIKTLLDAKAKSSDADEIRTIKNQINFIHGVLLMKDNIKKYVKSKDELDGFLDFNEPVLFGYHKRLKDDNYKVYLRKTYELQFVNVLYAVQIRSAAKSLMYRYFDYCDKTEIEIFHCNTD
jgi:hypothetical protein